MIPKQILNFPKIPFVESKEDFLKFAKLGEELYNLNLENSKIQKEVGEAMLEYNKNKNETIAKINYSENEKNYSLMKVCILKMLIKRFGNIKSAAIRFWINI